MYTVTFYRFPVGVIVYGLLKGGDVLQGVQEQHHYVTLVLYRSYVQR